MTTRRAPAKSAKPKVGTPTRNPGAARRPTLEIKIGIVQSPREISLETEQTSEQVAAAVAAALAEGSTVEFEDARGRKLVVAADKLAYVDIGEPSQRRVGFGG